MGIGLLCGLTADPSIEEITQAIRMQVRTLLGCGTGQNAVGHAGRLSPGIGVTGREVPVFSVIEPSF